MRSRSETEALSFRDRAWDRGAKHVVIFSFSSQMLPRRHARSLFFFPARHSDRTQNITRAGGDSAFQPVSTFH
jgi:hypothetical protein